MSAYGFADQIHRIRTANKKPPVDLVLRTNNPVGVCAAAPKRPTKAPPVAPPVAPPKPRVKNVGVLYGGGPRQKRDDPYGAGDIYPVFQVDDPRTNTKMFLNTIQSNRAIGRLPKDMYQSMWHFLMNHHTHWKRDTQMAMWRNVAAFYKLVKDSKAYPGWMMTYDFDERLSKEIAPFQETVVEVFRDLARQLGVATTDYSASTAAHLGHLPSLDSTGPFNGDPEPDDIGLSCTMAAASIRPSKDSANEMKRPAPGQSVSRRSPLCSTGGRGPLTREEIHLLRWFRESHPSTIANFPGDAPHAAGDAAKTTETVCCSKTGDSAHCTMMSHNRMRVIGMVLPDGSLPKGPDPMPLYWLQAKPDEFKEQFGRWNPVSASWTMHKNRSVVPIERRYAPLECGYGTNPETTPTSNGNPDDGVVKSHDFFCDYDETAMYDGTGLEPGVEYIQMQAEQLHEGVMLGAEQGWGKSETGDCLYYTPQLRHVEIDHRVAPKDVANKQYVYGWFGMAMPVQPSPCKGFRAEHPEYPGLAHPSGVWNSTNACWIYPLTNGKLSPVGVVECDTERERDVDMRESLDEDCD